MPITFVVGDELNVGLTFTQSGSSTPVNLTGYTLEAKVYAPVYSNPAGSFTNGGYTQGTTAATFTVSAVQLTQGKVNLGLSETQTAALSPAVGYRWYFRWQDTSGVTLTVLSGTFTVKTP